MIRLGARRVLVGTFRSIDADKLREAEQATSEERFALAVAGSNDGVWDWDVPGNKIFFSEQGQRLYGLEPGKTTRPRDEWIAVAKVHPEDAERQRLFTSDCFAGKASSLDSEWRMLHADGVYRWIRVRGVCIFDGEGRPTRMAGSVTDIEPQKRAEAAVLHAQRLEVTGTMAGGIAHDFNNILAAILGYGEMALRDAESGTRLRRAVESILVAGERGRTLVDRILLFSGNGFGERGPVHVEGIVREALELLTATLPADVRIESRLRAGGAAC